MQANNNNKGKNLFPFFKQSKKQTYSWDPAEATPTENPKQYYKWEITSWWSTVRNQGK